MTTEVLQLKALELAGDRDVPVMAFKASRHWVHKFLHCVGHSLRRRMSISQKMLDAYEEQSIAFQHHLINLRRSKTFLLGQIGNVDQAPMYLDVPSSYNVNEKGARQVLVRTTGHEKTRVTVMLVCTADEKELPPYVALKRKFLSKD